VALAGATITLFPGRSAAWSVAQRCAADPGIARKCSLERSRLSGAPLRKSYALHRIRDTIP